MSTQQSAGALITAIICCFVSATETRAQAEPAGATTVPPNADPRDLQGFWQAPPLDHSFAAGFSPPSGDATGSDAPPSVLPGGIGLSGTLPLKPEVAAKAKSYIQMVLKGTSVMTWHVACRPGPGQNTLADDIGGFEIIQTPTRVLFLFDTDNTYWEVYLDRAHPQNVKPSYLGHSVGHWEDNKLVVDTIGYNARSSILPGNVDGRQLHTVTRFWKDAGGRQLKYETYIEDPMNLTQPATLPVGFVNWTPDHRLYEEHCTQSTRPESNTDMVYEDFTREEAFPYLYKNKK